MAAAAVAASTGRSRSSRDEQSRAGARPPGQSPAGARTLGGLDLNPIVHITTEADWDAARRTGGYRGDTLESDGFIHFSTPEQVAATANLFFSGRHDLILLVVDPSTLGAALRYEPAPGGELFPHLYAPLALEAVTRVLPFRPGPDGRFERPDLS